jgi:hypothetical protein
VLDAIIFRLRTGCQWNHIPSVYGDDSTIHRCFVRWCRLGFFLGKARFGGALWVPIRRIVGKMARKRAW